MRHGNCPVGGKLPGSGVIKPDRLRLRSAHWQYRDKQEQNAHSITSTLTVQQNSEDFMSSIGSSSIPQKAGGYYRAKDVDGREAAHLHFQRLVYEMARL